MKDSIQRVVARYLSAGDVVPFGGKPKSLHFVKIQGVSYSLSDDGGPLGSPEEQAEWTGDARVIRGPGAGKFKYLWVLDTDRKMVTMWRAHDGNEKVYERASGLSSKLVRLDRRGQLNRVDHATFLIIRRAMEHEANENEAALKKYLIDNESDMQKRVNLLTQRYFDEQVLPDIERAISDVKKGAVPFGFKPHALDNVERQKMVYVMSQVIAKKFSIPLVEKYLASKGIDLEAPGADIQAAEWAVHDVTYAAYDNYLPPRVESTD